MATSIIWPKTALIPANVALNITPNNTSGGVSLAGSEQIVGNTPGRWRCAFGGIDLRTPAQFQAWNALSGTLAGRLNPLLIPIYDANQGPATAVSASVATANALPGAVTLDIQVTGGTIAAGMHFSNPLTDRLYRIVALTNDGGGLYSCTIWPPIREKLAVNNNLEFNDPYFRVKLATDTEMDLEIQLRRFGNNPTVKFVEDV